MRELASFPRWTVVRFFHFLFTVATSLSTRRYCHTTDFRICLFFVHTCINTCLRWRPTANVLFCSSNTISSHKITWIVWKKKYITYFFHNFSWFKVNTWIMNWYDNSGDYTAWTVSKYSVYLVRIFLYFDWIRRFTEYSVQMRENTDQKNSVFEQFLCSVIVINYS